MRLRLWLAVLFFLCLSAQGCGFHLRGNAAVPPALQQLILEPSGGIDSFQRALKPLLSGHGVTLLPTGTPHTTTLTILNQSIEEEPLAYRIDGQVTHIRLILRIDYELQIPRLERTFSKSVSSVKELSIEPNNLLGSYNEKQRLKQDLLLEAAHQLIQQLSIQKELQSS